MLNCFWGNIKIYLYFLSFLKTDWHKLLKFILTENKAPFSYKVITMTADDLVMQGAKASAAMVLIWISWNTLASTS